MCDISEMPKEYERMKKRDNIGVVVVIPDSIGRTWHVRLGESDNALEYKPVTLRVPKSVNKAGAEFIIGGTKRTVTSYVCSKHSNRIKLNFEEGPLWFSSKKSDSNTDKRYNPECAKMLEFACQTFPCLIGSNLKSKVQNLIKHGKNYNRRLAARQPVNYDGHFPPFVRTCQEILDALDDAGVIY